MSAEREHARYSPSSLKWRRDCPRWENKPGTSDAAAEGTMLHAACDSGKLDGLTEEQVTAVQMVRGIYADIEAELGAEAIPHAEECLHIRDMDPPLFGYLDRFWINGADATIADAKFGYTAVEDAEVNPQGWAYAVALWDTHPEVEGIRVIFAQPRLDRVTIGQFSRQSDYARLRTEVERIVERCKDQSIEPTPQEEACLYCGNKARCPALARLAVRAANSREGLTLPDEFHPSQITDPRQMAVAMRVAPILEDWAKSVKKSAVEMWLTGTHIDGYDLIEREGKPEILSAAGAYTAAKAMGVSKDEFLAACKISWGELKDAVGAHAPKGKKGKFQQELENALSDKGILERGAPVRYLKQTRNKE